MSLYNKYGPLKVSDIVEDFYKDVLASTRLRGYFANSDIRQLVSHQTKFLCKVMGGPDNYTGLAIAQAHQGLGITEDEFGEVAALLKKNLEKHGMDADEIDTVIGAVASLKGEIVAS